MHLTDKQQKFCDEYLVDLNSTQAAIRAGYSKTSAKSIGSENLSKPDIQAYLQKKRKTWANKLEVTQERILTEYARVAFSDIRKFYTEQGMLLLPGELDDDSAAALAGIEVFEEFAFDLEGNRNHVGDTKKLKIHNKIQALDSLAKHLGMFEKDNQQRKPEVKLDISSLSPLELKAILSMKKKMANG